MLYNTFDDTIMEPIGWLFEVLSGVLYLPFQFNEDTIIAGLIVITPIAAGALCLIIDWVFDVRDEFSNFHRLEDYTSSFRQHFQRYGRPRQSRVDLKALKEYQDYKHKQAMELQEKKPHILMTICNSRWHIQKSKTLCKRSSLRGSPKT